MAEITVIDHSLHAKETEIHPEQASTQESTGRKEILDRVCTDLVSDWLAEGVHPLENDKTYLYLQTLTPAELELLAKQVAGGIKVRALTATIGKDYLGCLIHPGVAARLEQFIDFLQAVPDSQQLTPQEAVQRFANHLGEITLYRGMTLTPQELEIIKSQGIRAPALRTPETAQKALKALLTVGEEADLDRDYHSDPALHGSLKSFGDDVMFKLRDVVGRDAEGQLEASAISLSLSEHPEIADSVGWHHSGRKDDPNVKLYTFKVRLPRIMTYEEEGLTGEQRGPQFVFINGRMFGGVIEIFSPLGVSWSQIEEVVEHTDAPPPLEGVF